MMSRVTNRTNRVDPACKQKSLARRIHREHLAPSLERFLKRRIPVTDCTLMQALIELLHNPTSRAETEAALARMDHRQNLDTWLIGNGTMFERTNVKVLSATIAQAHNIRLERQPRPLSCD